MVAFPPGTAALSLVLLAANLGVSASAGQATASEWPPAIMELMPMPQTVRLTGNADMRISADRMLACLSGAAFGDGKGRLARAVQRELSALAGGGAVVVQPPPLHALASLGLNGSTEAARRTVCYEEAATSGMTPLFVVQSARIDGMRARADAERGAAGPDKLDAASAEAYVLNTSGAYPEIAALDAAGAFRGVQTLVQLCLHGKSAEVSSAVPAACTIPSVLISDWPDLANRGVMLDISRNRVHTMATFELIVDSLAAMRFNEVQLYTEHTFAYPAHAQVWAHSGAITPEEMRALSGYCFDRFITLVANQQSFGHLQHWLKHAPYQRFAESPAGSRKLWDFDFCCPLFRYDDDYSCYCDYYRSCAVLRCGTGPRRPPTAHLT